jgi:hypothetical protein
MPAQAGIQDFEKLNKIKNWIPAFAGMTPLFPNCDTVSQRGGIFFFLFHIFILSPRGRGQGEWAHPNFFTTSSLLLKGGWGDFDICISKFVFV